MIIIVIMRESMRIYGLYRTVLLRVQIIILEILYRATTLFTSAHNTFIKESMRIVEQTIYVLLRLFM